jgi:lysophospholipase L1-like esterase
MWAGRGFTAFSILAWIVVIALATHRSRSPVVLDMYSNEYAAVLAVAVAMAALVTVLVSTRVRAALTALRWRLLPLALIPLILTLGTIEVLLRSFDLFGASFYGEVYRYMLRSIPDDRLFYRYPAHERGTYEGVEIALNELGLRDAPIGDKTPGWPRVLLLGDSVAFGWGVRVEDTFAAQLEQLLPVEVINTGVPSYNTVQELAFLRLHFAELRPDIVILPYVENDIDLAAPRPPDLGTMPSIWNQPGDAMEFVLSRSWLYRMVDHLSPVITGMVAPSIVQDDRGTPGWRASMAALADMARYCRDRAVPLAVFQYRMLASPRGDALHEALPPLAETERFHFADVLPWFHDRDLRQLTVSFVDSHPNAEAHGILADGISEFLMSRGVIHR